MKMYKYKYKYKYLSKYDVADSKEVKVLKEKKSPSEEDSAEIYQNKTIRVEHKTFSAVTNARVLVFFDFYFEPLKEEMKSVYCTTSPFGIGQAMSLTLPDSASNVDLHLLSAAGPAGPWYRGKDACSREKISLPACFRIGGTILSPSCSPC
jgi:hypothetical protein